ncbi:MAG: ribokinase [Bacillota bacterium]|jgi:ribokinase
MAKLAVVGSLNMDLAVKVARLPCRGETVSAERLQISPGGKGANQAVAAARLGADVSMVGRIGADSYGEDLLASLRSSGVDVSMVSIDRGCSTGLALVTVDEEALNTIVVYPGANGAFTPQYIGPAKDSIASSKAMVAQLEVPLESVESALKIARANSVTTILNPAPAREIPPELLSCVDIMIPNEVEAAAICGCSAGRPSEAMEASARLRRMGPERVIITLGEKGAVYSGPEGGFHVPAFRVDAVDSTGAGDAFVAGFAVAWIQGFAPEYSMRYACAVGALATTRMGAQASFPSADQVANLIGGGQSSGQAESHPGC